jgi:hypothetical protein
MRKYGTSRDSIMNKWLALIAMAAGLCAAGWITAQEPGVRKADLAVYQDESGGEKKEKSKKSEAAALPLPAGGVRIELGQRNAIAEARRGALGYTSAPVIDVAQPRADLLLVTMAGMAAAAGLPCENSEAGIAFDLVQDFKVIDDRPNPRPLRLILEAQLTGLFRGNRDGAGTAMSTPAEATVTAGGAAVAHAGFPGRAHTGKDILVISDRTPTIETIIGPGEYNLCQKFAIRCTHPKKCFHKNVVMAVFGDAGRTPEWMNLLDPSRDLPKGRDLGFRVAIRIEPVALPPAAPRIPDARPASFDIAPK